MICPNLAGSFGESICLAGYSTYDLACIEKLTLSLRQLSYFASVVVDLHLTEDLIFIKADVHSWPSFHRSTSIAYVVPRTRT